MKQKWGTWFLVACAATVLVGCGGHAAAPNPSVNDSANVAAVSNSTGNSADNSLDNNVNITVDNSANGTSNDASNNTTNDTNNTNVTVGQINISSQADAHQLLMTVYASMVAKDKNFRVSYQGTQKDNSHTVYVYQLYDDMGDHQATIGWVWIRDDGMFQDGILMGGWVSPSDWQLKVQQQAAAK